MSDLRDALEQLADDFDGKPHGGAVAYTGATRILRDLLAAHPVGPAPEWTGEERGCVETALSAADAGDAGHWPTVAAWLALEVRRLRAAGEP